MSASRLRDRRHPVITAIVGAVVGLVLACATAAFAQAAPDAFYLALLRDGKAEMLRGDAVAAKKSFRLACFGFLEQPVLLAEGLVRLGLAETALNDSEEFTATFSRLAEVEERFGAYAAAAVSAEERRAFEQKALEWVTPEALRALPSFAPLLARRTEVDFAKLSPRERTRELEKRSASEPGNPRWKVLLAQDDAAEQRWTRVAGHLEGVPDSAEGGAAGCLRGQALARLKRCAEAVPALAACAGATSDASLAEAQVSCLVMLDRAEEARAFAARIVRPAADASAVRKAIARLPQPPSAVPAAPKEKAPPAPAATVGGKPKPAQEVAAPAPSAPPTVAANAAKAAAPKAKAGKLSADEERLVAQARGMLKSVDNRDELRRGFATFRPVADRLPERGDLQLLAGEIAYRAGLWPAGAEYLARSTPGGRGPNDPTLRFYYAVCLYEAGSFAAAAEVAATGLEKLPPLPFVDAYLQKIRAARP